jgi:hypothetical protein
VSLPPPVGAHRDAFDVARPQRAPAVQQAPLHHSGVTDQVGAVPCQRVPAAKRVLPIAVGQVGWKTSSSRARAAARVAADNSAVCAVRTCVMTGIVSRRSFVALGAELGVVRLEVEDQRDAGQVETCGEQLADPA